LGKVTGAAPALVQGAAQGTSSRSWLLPVMLLALIPALWLLTHAHKPANEPPAANGAANRSMPDGDTWTPSLPSSLELHFRTGTVPDEVKSQLKDFAAALSANPDTQVSVSAFTDNAGSEARNLRVSQDRADAVRAELMRMGVSADRITATGFGEQNPIADNSTAEGRDANNRVVLQIRR
jgi:outer membrane protein OmpA-like peptidoglycan-associated protein